MIFDSSQLAEYDHLNDLTKQNETTIGEVNEHPNTPGLVDHDLIGAREQRFVLGGRRR